MAESLLQGTLIRAASFLPLLLNLKVPCFIGLQGAPLPTSEAAGAPRWGWGAGGLWVEREQGCFSLVFMVRTPVLEVRDPVPTGLRGEQLTAEDSDFHIEN